MRRGRSINDILMPLADCPTQAFLSNETQVADILEWTLRQSGKADIIQSSFSISEEYLRRLFFMRRNNPDLIRSATLLLDHKATNKTAKLWPFIIQTIERTYLSDNHSKILVVNGSLLDAVIITSQNLTRGNRYESSVISVIPEVVENIRNQLLNVINNQSVPLNDIYAESTRNGGEIGFSLHDCL